MKKLICLSVLLASATVASAQGPAGVVAPTPAVVAGEPAWAVVPVNAAPGNPYSVGGRRSSFGRRPDSSQPQHVRAAVAQAYPRPAPAGSKVSFPAWRAASVELTNAGAREVKRISLDFVFRDAPGGGEVLRLPLRAGRRLRAGERAVLKKTVKGTARHRRGDGAHLAVEIREVVYADGTLWRAGGSH